MEDKPIRALDFGDFTPKEEKEHLQTQRQEIKAEALVLLRKARGLLKGKRFMNTYDIGVFADSLEYSMKKETDNNEPEDLRDDWPHASYGLREAA